MTKKMVKYGRQDVDIWSRAKKKLFPTTMTDAVEWFLKKVITGKIKVKDIK